MAFYDFSFLLAVSKVVTFAVGVFGLVTQRKWWKWRWLGYFGLQFRTIFHMTPARAQVWLFWSKDLPYLCLPCWGCSGWCVEWCFAWCFVACSWCSMAWSLCPWAICAWWDATWSSPAWCALCAAWWWWAAASKCFAASAWWVCLLMALILVKFVKIDNIIKDSNIMGAY